MSFLYDKKTYLPIIDSAFSKLAQQGTPVPSVDPNLLTKLVRRLDSELSPVSTDVSTMAKGDEITGEIPQAGAQLKLNDLKLNNLIKFLADNKIKFGESGLHERVVYPQSEFHSASPDEVENFDRLGNYMVNPVALANYIKYLQNKFQKQNNPLINSYMKLLVDNANQQFPNSGLSRLPQTESLSPELSDDTELDKIDNVFSPKLGVREGPNSLTVKDLNSKEALNAWLQQHQAKVVSYDNNGMAHEQYYAKFADLKSATNTILSSLYNRADRLRSLATNNQLARKYDYYKNRLKELGATTLDSVPNTGTNSGETQLVSFPGKTDNKDSSSGSQFIERVIDSLPLNNRDINLEMMKDFFSQLQQLSQTPVTTQLISSALSKMQTLRTYLNADYNVFPINTTPQDFARRLTSPRNYLPALNLLSEIVGDVRDLIAEFYRTHFKGINDNNQWKSAVLNQIGRNQTDNSFFFRNTQFLQFLKSEIDQVIKVK